MIREATATPTPRASDLGLPLMGVAPNDYFAALRIDKDGHVILSDKDIERIAARLSGTPGTIEPSGSRSTEQPPRDQCPVCGSPVIVHSSDEGTSHYEPLADGREALRERVIALARECDLDWFDRQPLDDGQNFHDLRAALAALDSQEPT